MTQQFDIKMTVNGREYTGRVEPRLTLADFIRQELDLTGHTWAASTEYAAPAPSWWTAKRCGRACFWQCRPMGRNS